MHSHLDLGYYIRADGHFVESLYHRPVSTANFLRKCQRYLARAGVAKHVNIFHSVSSALRDLLNPNVIRFSRHSHLHHVIFPEFGDSFVITLKAKFDYPCWVLLRQNLPCRGLCSWKTRDISSEFRSGVAFRNLISFCQILHAVSSLCRCCISSVSSYGFRWKHGFLQQSNRKDLTDGAVNRVASRNRYAYVRRWSVTSTGDTWVRRFTCSMEPFSSRETFFVACRPSCNLLFVGGFGWLFVAILLVNEQLGVDNCSLLLGMWGIELERAAAMAEWTWRFPRTSQ